MSQRLIVPALLRARGWTTHPLPVPSQRVKKKRKEIAVTMVNAEKKRRTKPGSWPLPCGHLREAKGEIIPQPDSRF